ncbi:hypothetical protein C8Q80DRAFT_1274101 [Daedaleopsis nitida]|nr:hypothetical protein C8Q80DRAFT_1274101 [Daedaleopsis nitida]
MTEKLGPRGVKAFSLHPGAILTNLFRFIPEDGSDFASLRALDRELGTNKASRI